MNIKIMKINHINYTGKNILNKKNDIFKYTNSVK